MQSTFVAAVISAVSCFKFMSTHIMLIWLNVYWMLPLAWQRHEIIESLPSKISFPSISPFPLSLQCYFKNPASIITCFPFFHTPFFTSNFIKFQLDSTPIGNLWLCGLINITDSKLVGINDMKLLIECHNL